MYIIFVITVLWPSKCYLTVFVVRETRTLPQFRVAFAGGRLRNSAQWRSIIWLASVNTHVLEELLKKPAVIRSDQIRINLSFELLLEWQGTSSSSGKMVDKFVGTWKMTTSDNFDEYMKALGMILHYLVTCKYFQFAKLKRKVKPFFFLDLTYALNIILLIVINIKVFREWKNCMSFFQVWVSLLGRWETGPSPTWSCVWMIRGSYAWSRRAPSKLLRSNLNSASHSRRSPRMIERLRFVME